MPRKTRNISDSAFSTAIEIIEENWVRFCHFFIPSLVRPIPGGAPSDMPAARRDVNSL